MYNKKFYKEKKFINLYNKIFKGFTLAEVLITLGIIGIIAAMTIPTLIQSYKKKEATTRLKKFNSIMAQAVMMSENENGVINNLIQTGAGVEEVEQWFYQYLSPYLLFEKSNYNTNDRGFTVYLLDGSSFYIWKANCTEIYFDINGPKKPNIMGKDQFNFMICSEEIPGWADNRHWGAYYNTTDKSRSLRLKKCETNARFCSGLLEYDNWEFKEDYPYKL